MVVAGEIHDVVVVADAVVVVVSRRFVVVVVDFGLVVLGVPGGVEEVVGSGGGRTAPGGAVFPGVVVVDSAGSASPWPEPGSEAET
jgi:hypothetical protein